jgi:hypothetical protein
VVRSAADALKELTDHDATQELIARERAAAADRGWNLTP